jgi:hypothetical protein
MDHDEFLAISTLDLIKASNELKETYSNIIVSKSEYDILKILLQLSDGNVNIFCIMISEALNMNFDKVINIVKCLHERELISMVYFRNMPAISIKDRIKKIKCLLKEFEKAAQKGEAHST